MKQRARRLIKWTAIGLAATLTALLGFLAFALTTEPGARIVLRMAAARIPLNLEFADVSGNLRGPLSLTDISGATPSLEFTAKRLTFDMRLWGLVRKRIHLDSMSLVGLRAAFTEDTSATEEQPPPLDTIPIEIDMRSLELPVAVVLDRFQLEDAALLVSDSISISEMRVTASGTHEAYEADVAATLTASKVGQAQIEASGRGSMNEFRLEDLRALLLDGEVRGSGTLSWRPRIEWQISLDAESLAPATLAPRPDDWPGRVSLSANVAGRLIDQQLEVDAGVDTLFGTVRGQPLTGVIAAAIRGPEYSFDRVDLDWGPVRLDVAGLVSGDRLDFDFDLHAPDLGAVLPRSDGSVSAVGELAGSLSAPIVTATVSANAVTLDQFKLRQAHARVDVDWQDRGRNEVDVRIDDLEYSSQTIDSATIRISGLREAHEVAAAATSQGADLRLMATGGFTDWTWSGTLGDLGIATRDAGAWRLDEAASLSASTTAVAFEDLCMLAATGDFCIGGTWDSQSDWEVHSSMNELPFSLLRPVLPDELTIEGKVSGRLRAGGKTEIPEFVELDLRPSAGWLEYVLQDSVFALSYREAQLRVTAQGDSTRGNLSVQVTESGGTEFGSLSAEWSLSSLAELIDGFSADSLVSVLTEEWALNSSVDRFPLSLLRTALPPTLTMDGMVSGHVNAVGHAGRPEYLELDLRPGAGSFEYMLQDTAIAISYREARLSVNSQGDSLRGNLSLQLAESSSTEFGSLSAELNLSSLGELIDGFAADSLVGALTEEWTLNSSVDRIPLAFLRPALPQTLTIDGTVSGQVSTVGRAGELEYLEVELRPSAGAVGYALRDTTEMVRYREARLSANSLGDSLHANLALQVATADGTEFGVLSAEVGLPSFSTLLDEISAGGLVAALQRNWTLESSIDQIPLALFNIFLPSGATLAGSLDGTLETYAEPDGTITGRLELEPRSATSQRSFGAEVHTIRLIDTKLSASAGSDGVRGEATFTVAQADGPLQGTVSAVMALPQFTKLDQPLGPQPIDARVEGRMDLGLLDELFADFSGSSGQLAVDLTAGNTFGDIELSGQYRVRGQTDVASLGIDLRDIDINASDSPDSGLQIEGSVSSGAGRLTIAGTSPAIPTPESPARLTIRGDNFLALRNEQINLVVSPDLEVLIGGRSVDVRGEVAVPRAMIDVLEVPQTAVGVSGDVVYVGVTEDAATPPLDVTAEITLSLGENVVFRGFGFNTHLDGAVVVTDQPGRMTQGRGELVLRAGTYRGYGQNLSVEPGRLIFTGPLDNPTVDVRAYRRATDGTRAGFLVGGTLKSLDVAIWSDPAKTDSDALSYILFGRSMSQGTEADQLQAGNAAAILGGNMLAMSMASSVGLHDARIEAGARQQETAFYAGRYLSPRLYVAYGVGLYEPINVLRVRYLISRKFTLQAETGTRDSGDILYRIEF